MDLNAIIIKQNILHQSPHLPRPLNRWTEWFLQSKIKISIFEPCYLVDSFLVFWLFKRQIGRGQMRNLWIEHERYLRLFDYSSLSVPQLWSKQYSVRTQSHWKLFRASSPKKSCSPKYSLLESPKGYLNALCVYNWLCLWVSHNEYIKKMFDLKKRLGNSSYVTRP